MERAAGLMQFEHVEPVRIARLWPVIAEILAPAVRNDPTGMRMEELHAQLLDGRFQLIEGHDADADGLLAFHLFEEGGEMCCFASYLAGRVNGGPRQMIRTMRSLMAAFEDVSREAGVAQMFIGGRDWGRIFPDYQPTGDAPNRRRKRL